MKSTDSRKTKTCKVSRCSTLKYDCQDTELRFSDSAIKGYVQITTLKEKLFLVSGHLELNDEDAEVRLIFPTGHLINNLEKDDNYLLFSAVTKKSFSLSDIQYQIR